MIHKISLFLIPQEIILRALVSLCFIYFYSAIDEVYT